MKAVSLFMELRLVWTEHMCVCESVPVGGRGGRKGISLELEAAYFVNYTSKRIQ